MGTFIIRPTIQQTGGTPYDNSGSFPDPFAGWAGDPLSTLLDAVRSQTNLTDLQTICFSSVSVQAFDQALRLAFTGFSIYLDGSLVPIQFVDLPSGFTALSASVKCNADMVGAPNIPGDQAHFYLQNAPGVNGTIDTTEFAYDFSGVTKPSILDIYNNGMGLRIVMTNLPGDSCGVFPIYDLKVEGTYDIEATRWQLQTTSPVRPGDKIKVNALDTQLNGVKQILFNYNDPTDGLRKTITLNTGIDGENPYIIINGITYQWIDLVIIQEPFVMWFYLPPGFGPYHGPVDVSFVGNGTQFSGTVQLGTLNILFEDASGIYVLDETQTHDTVYSREGYTTDDRLLFIHDDEEDEEERSFFSMMPYPRKILTPKPDRSNEFRANFKTIGVLRIIVITRNVEFPSPFAKTGFVP